MAPPDRPRRACASRPGHRAALLRLRHHLRRRAADDNASVLREALRFKGYSSRIRKDSVMAMTTTLRAASTRRPLNGLGRLTMTTLLGVTLLLLGFMALTIGTFEPILA